MAVTANSQTYAFDPPLVSALRITLGKMPVEQNYTGPDALAAVERTNKENVDRAGCFHIPVGQFASGLHDWFDGDDEGSDEQANESTIAQFRRAYVRRPIRVNDTDEDDTGGDVALFRIYQHKLAEARRAVRTEVNTKLVSGTSTPKALQGIPLTIEENPSTSGAYGTLDGATHTYWLNKTTASSASVGSAALNLEDQMERLWRLLTIVGSAPDWWLVSANVLGFMQTLSRGSRNFNVDAGGAGSDGMTGSLGASKITFMGKKIVMDGTMSDGFAYAMNNTAYKLGVISKREFTLGPAVRLESNNQSGYIVYFYWAGQGLCYQRAGLGQLHGITA